MLQCAVALAPAVGIHISVRHTITGDVTSCTNIASYFKQLQSVAQTCFSNYCKWSVVKEHYTVHKANEGSGQAKSILNANGHLYVSNCSRHSLNVLQLNVDVTIAVGVHKRAIHMCAE
eukprot:20529-Heterococcus_DN1.PRE.2